MLGSKICDKDIMVWIENMVNHLTIYKIFLYHFVKIELLYGMLNFEKRNYKVKNKKGKNCTLIFLKRLKILE